MTTTGTESGFYIAGSPGKHFAAPFAWLWLKFPVLVRIIWEIKPAFVFNLVTTFAQCFKIIWMIVCKITILMMYKQILIAAASFAFITLKMFINVEVECARSSHRFIIPGITGEEKMGVC